MSEEDLGEISKKKLIAKKSKQTPRNYNNSNSNSSSSSSMNGNNNNNGSGIVSPDSFRDEARDYNNNCLLS